MCPGALTRAALNRVISERIFRSRRHLSTTGQ